LLTPAPERATFVGWGQWKAFYLEKYDIVKLCAQFLGFIAELNNYQ
jgi:hypothetical protein